MALLSYTWLLLKMCLRFGIMVINNLVAIPSYLLYLLALLPLRLCRPRLFWELEGVMFKWLLAIVASWGWVAGYTGGWVGLRDEPLLVPAWSHSLGWH